MRRYIGLWTSSPGNSFSQLSFDVSISVLNNSPVVELQGYLSHSYKNPTPENEESLRSLTPAGGEPQVHSRP